MKPVNVVASSFRDMMVRNVFPAIRKEFYHAKHSVLFNLIGQSPTGQPQSNKTLMQNVTLLRLRLRFRNSWRRILTSVHCTCFFHSLGRRAAELKQGWEIKNSQGIVSAPTSSTFSTIATTYWYKKSAQTTKNFAYAPIQLCHRHFCYWRLDLINACLA